MAAIVCVYGLKDPRDGHLYYIGRTKNFSVRRRHLRQRGSHSAPFLEWVAQVETAGYAPAPTILEETTFAALRQAERQWIDRCLKAGEPLVNIRFPGNRPLKERPDHARQPRKLKTRRKPCTCLRCGYVWTPYGKHIPRKCARCLSPYWQQPYTRKQPPAPEGGTSA